MPWLFSYGTLQQRDVQLANFGRTLRGFDDALPRFAIEPYRIQDVRVIATSGKEWHTMAVFNGDDASRIPGKVFEITDAELTHADAYEVAAYRRLPCTLLSGRRAWAYVDGRHQPASVIAIDKVAWIHLRDGRVLSTRSRGKDTWYLPGGKREAGESDEACLVREIREELAVTLRSDSLRSLGVFAAAAHGKPPGTEIHMACYAAEYDGELCASAEIEEFAWLGYADRAQSAPVDQLIFDTLHHGGELR